VVKVLVLGGDGFCGWATSLYLSAKGHDVTILDNLSRRKIDVELETESLTPIRPMSVRLQAWHEVSGRTIQFHILDVAQDYAGLLAMLNRYSPDAVIHFAEQRAAPYSMKTFATRRYTVENNTTATHNLLCAIVETGRNIHLLHLGTMGVYGYGTAGDMPVPEGYLKVRITQPNGPAIEREIMHPADPGSVYHMTKTLDALLFYFYNKNDNLRITDLHQGIVWGTSTRENEQDERLINRFDYDGEYGTVLNRFLVQAAIDHPLTVHGVGGQKRAFIHLRDCVRCIELALLHPPEGKQRVQIFNQMTETHRLIDLARKVSALTGAKIQHVDNPRVEEPTNELIVQNDGFLKIGMTPITLDDGLMLEVINIARKYRHRIDPTKIPATSRWRR
jgi:UDP-sulfoquinovose synthase